ncbi:MAG: hypothetical protein H6581_10085 [Bacteroidia bacterium]|nr:hypothetical protein [Bacteroidia bacterium]
MNNISIYETQLVERGEKIKFLFESNGVKTIIKAIEYTLIAQRNGRKIYNLGFGDYNEENGEILDDINSNNGDMRKVFNTVLNSIPLFFEINKNAAIWVQGSDSQDEFKSECQKTCYKNCKVDCKNFNRRIKTYRYFVDKHFIELTREYIFFGYTNEKKPSLVQYIPNTDYLGIFVFRKI